MELFLSINKKFYNNFDYKWINLFYSYDIYNVIDGCEFYISFCDEKENQYINNLISNKMYNTKWRFQFHAPNLTNYLSLSNSYLPMLQFYENISQVVGYKIKVNFHPIESNISMIDSINQSNNELYVISNLINKHNFNIDVLIENLNTMPNVYRCNLDDLDNILNNDKIGLTYDIGHMTVDNKYEYNLNEKHIGKIRNIHVHDTQDKEHFPYFNNKLFLEEFFRYLNNIGYDDTIVAEIALDYLSSNTFEKRILEYTRNMYILSYYLKLSNQKNT